MISLSMHFPLVKLCVCILKSVSLFTIPNVIIYLTTCTSTRLLCTSNVFNYVSICSSNFIVFFSVIFNVWIYLSSSRLIRRYMPSWRIKLCVYLSIELNVFLFIYLSLNSSPWAPFLFLRPSASPHWSTPALPASPRITLPVDQFTQLGFSVSGETTHLSSPVHRPLRLSVYRRRPCLHLSHCCCHRPI